MLIVLTVRGSSICELDKITLPHFSVSIQGIVSNDSTFVIIDMQAVVSLQSSGNVLTTTIDLPLHIQIF